MVLIFCLVCIGHARARDEEVVSASQVYFLPNPPRYPPPGQPPALSLRHIVDKVRKLSPLLPGVDLACNAGVFWACECTFSYKAAILNSVTPEDWGEEIFAEGVGVKWRKWATPQPLPRLCTNPLPVKHPVAIQDGGIEPIYLAFRIPL